MSSTSKVMNAVSVAFSFTSDKVVENLTEFVRRESIELNENQLRRMNSIIKSSISQSLSLTSNSIEKSTK